jgi:hypothetical protein
MQRYTDRQAGVGSDKLGLEATSLGFMDNQFDSIRPQHDDSDDNAGSPAQWESGSSYFTLSERPRTKQRTGSPTLKVLRIGQ